MKYRILLIAMFLALLTSCKSVDGEINKKNFASAYALSKKDEEKLNVINSMIAQNKYIEAYEICKNDKKDKVVKDAYKKNIVKIYNDDGDDNVLDFIYMIHDELLGDKDFQKAWDCLEINNLDQGGRAKRVFNTMKKAQMFNELEGYSSNDDFLQHNFLCGKIQNAIKAYIRMDKFQSASRQTTNANILNALNNIKTIYCYINYSTYNDDWPRDVKPCYKRNCEIIDIVDNSDMHYWINVDGQFSGTSFHFPLKEGQMYSYPLASYDILGYNVIKNMPKVMQNQALRESLYAYFDQYDIWNARDLIEYLKKDYQ